MSGAGVRLGWVCALALALTAAVAFTNQNLVHATLENHIAGQAVIERARETRHSVQDAAESADEAVAADTAGLLARRIEDLTVALDDMRAARGATSEAVRDRFAAAGEADTSTLGHDVRGGLADFEEGARATDAALAKLLEILRDPDQATRPGNAGGPPARAAAAAARREAATLLDRIADLSGRIAGEMNDRLETSRARSRLNLGIILVLLLALGGFVFMPVLRRADLAYEAMRRAADDLAVSERMFRQTFESAAVGLARVGDDGRIIGSNNAFASFAGESDPRRLEGSNVFLLLHPDDHPAVRRLVDTLADSAAPVLPATVRVVAVGPPQPRAGTALVNADGGGERWFQLQVSVIRREREGLPLHLLWCLQDTTERTGAMLFERRARAFAEAVVDTVREPLVVLDPELRVRSANRAFHETFGLDRESMPGMTLQRGAAEEWDLPGVALELEPLLHSDTPIHDVELVENFPRIGRRVMRINARRIGPAGRGGAFEGILLALEDITDRRRAETELRRGERRLRLMADNATDLITRHTLDGRCVYASPAIRRLLGLPQSSLEGSSLADISHPDDRHALRNLFEGTMAGAAAAPERTALHRVRRAHGDWVWLETRAKYVRPEEPPPGCAGDTESDPPFAAELVAVSRDVTARRAAEDALRVSNERVTNVLESILDGFTALDRDWRYLYLNSAAEAILGAKRADLLGQVMFDVYPKLRGSPFHLAAIEALETGGIVEIETGSLYRDVVFDIRVFPGRDGVSVYFRDVTERRAADLSLRQLNEKLVGRTAELEAVNQELRAFSYSVSHDLRAPLRTIDGFSRALLEDCAPKLDDNGRDHLARVINATGRMGRLIDAMLSLSRVSLAELAREETDLSAMAESVARDLADADPDRRVAFTCAPGLTATADPRLMRALLENLLGNAWKFTGATPAPAVEFGVVDGADGRPPEFFVTDNGAGFDMAYAGKLFGAFQRLHGEREFEGTGIGLATVQRIVRRHGGAIRAKADPGHGATFHFTLEA